MSHEEESTTQSSGVPRRTIVKGAAWSIPVVAAAVAAPAASASTEPCVGDLNVIDAGYIRFDETGWYGELQSNATGARLGIGGILPGSRMRALVAVQNPTDCDFRGTIRLQIDLPPRALLRDPSSQQGLQLTLGASYQRDGETWRRYYFDGAVSISARTTYRFGIVWTLADGDTIRTYFGPQEGPQRWSVLGPTQGSMGWRFPNPRGTVYVDGQPKWDAGYNNTLAQNAGWWIHSYTVNLPAS